MHVLTNTAAREGDGLEQDHDQGHDQEEGILEAGSHLFILLECKRPLAGAARYALSGIHEVTLGRGDERFVLRRSGRLEIRVPDPMMSLEHARLLRTPSGWTIEDDGSTCGTLVDGQPITSAPLEDGALIELGMTLFSLRSEMLAPRSLQTDAESGDVREYPEGLATLVPEYAQCLRSLRAKARSSLSVLLLGESGTGKEVLARALHDESRRPGAFVAVNCGAIPAAQVDSQLFGHVKGSAVGAVRDEPGFLRASDRGTLFLDEVGDLPRASQARLLRVLEQGIVVPVGGGSGQRVDLHVVSATHRPIEPRVDADGLRADLYARLAGFTCSLSPLRERREDLGLLIAELLPRIAPERAGSLELSVELGRALFDYDWPLNVRELKHCLSAAVVFATGGVLELAHAPVGLRTPALPRAQPLVGNDVNPLDAESSQLREGLVRALQKSRGNVSEVARVLGRTRTQVHRWMRRFGIDPATHRR